MEKIKTATSKLKLVFLLVLFIILVFFEFNKLISIYLIFIYVFFLISVKLSISAKRFDNPAIHYFFLVISSSSTIVFLILFIYIYRMMHNPFGILEFIEVLLKTTVLPIIIAIDLKRMYQKRELFPSLPYLDVYLACIIILLPIAYLANAEAYETSLSGDCTNSGEYSHYIIKKYKDQMIERMIESDKNMRRAYVQANGGTENEANAMIISLQAEYDREYRKFNQYCAGESMYCHTEIFVHYDEGLNRKIYLQPSEVHSIITYRFDDESIKFFNSVDYVNKEYFSNTDKLGNRSHVRVFVPTIMSGYKIELYSGYICQEIRFDTSSDYSFLWDDNPNFDTIPKEDVIMIGSLYIRSRRNADSL